jgi:hypothetical protein
MRKVPSVIKIHFLFFSTLPLFQATEIKQGLYLLIGELYSEKNKQICMRKKWFLHRNILTILYTIDTIDTIMTHKILLGTMEVFLL